MLIDVSVLRDVEIKHLVALRAVAEEGTFGRAAGRLGYTQSAVSQQIAGLERALGSPVFDRPGGPRPVELTPLGELLLEHARDVLGRIDSAGASVERFLRGESGPLAVGTFQSVTTAILPTIVGRLRAEAPGVEIQLHESNDKETFPEQLLSGELDIAFTLDDGWPGIDTEILFDDPFLVVTSLDEGRAGSYPVGDLIGRGLVGYQPTSCQREIEDGLRDAVGADLDWVFRTDDNHAVVALVRAGMGAAVVPRLAVDVGDPSIAVHEITPPIPPRRVGLSWRSGRTLSPAARRFVELAREVCPRQDAAARCD